MSLQSRLRPDWRNPDIGRGVHVKSRPLLRYTSEEARLLEDQLIAGLGGMVKKKRRPSTTTTPAGDGTTTRSKKTWAKIVGALRVPSTVNEISAKSGISSRAIRNNMNKMRDAGVVRLKPVKSDGGQMAPVWELAQ